jgi:uncharacterized protein
MFDRWFSRIFISVQQHRWLVIGLSGVVIVISIMGLRYVAFDNNVELMLPGNEAVHRTMHFLRDSNLSDKVIISLELRSAEHTTQDLIQAVEAFQKSLHSPFVTEVISGVPVPDLGEQMLFFLKYSPQLIDEHALSEIEQQIVPPQVQVRLRQLYLQMLAPGSAFIMPFLRSDPLGITLGILHRLEKLFSLLDYEVTLKNGHFVSQDGKHAMLIVQTPVVLTDGFGSRGLIAYLQEQLRGLPDFIVPTIVAGHLHSISNEDVIKKDIRLTSIIASVGFLLLFLVAFRDMRALMVFIMPLIAVLVATNLSFLVFEKLSYFIIGMGTVIAGIALDFGIFVYVAMRAGGGPNAVKKIAKPVVAGALTTVSVFAAFFFSSVQGYHQLALFSNLSLIFCLLYALFILPHSLNAKSWRGPFEDGKASRSYLARRHLPDKLILGCWMVLMVIAVLLSYHVSFDSDIGRFDGSEPYVMEAERKFHQVWGGQSQPAILVVSGEDMEDAQERNEQFYREALRAVGEDNFSSFAAIWPSKKTRQANAERWKKFWEQGRATQLQTDLQKEGAAYHFSDNAFAPFFDLLNAPPPVEDAPREVAFWQQLEQRFVLKKTDSYQLLSFFPDKDQFIQPLEALSEHYPDTFVVSRSTFSEAISRAISSELTYLSAIAVFSIVLLTRVLLKSTRLTALALLPVLTSILMILGILPVLRLPLTSPNVIAAMVVVGIVSDYGIFIVYDCRYKLDAATHLAVTLAACTTLIGAGVLLFAQHPVMYSIGVTMVTGVLSGFFTALLIVPRWYRLWIGPGSSEHTSRA